MKIFKILIVLTILGLTAYYGQIQINSNADNNSMPISEEQQPISRDKEKSALEININNSEESVLNITDQAEFDLKVIKSDIPVIVDFYADWCGPCKIFGPVFKETSGSWKNKVRFVKVNVDKAREIAFKYQIRGIPAIRIFKAGALVNSSSGYMNSEELNKLIKNNI
jgi:thioredoxin